MSNKCGCCGDMHDSLIYLPMLAVCTDCARYAVESVVGEENFAAKLTASQEPLGDDFQRVLDDNYWGLLVRTDKEECREVDP